MEYQEIPNWIRAIIPLLLFLGAVTFALMKNHFISKKDFKDFKKKHYEEHRELERRMDQQGKDIIEIKTNIKHVAKSLDNIERIMLNDHKQKD